MMEKEDKHFVINDGKRILRILNRRIRQLKERVFCKHHKIILEYSYDNIAECPKQTMKCSSCGNDELASYEELLNFKKEIYRQEIKK